MPGLGSSSRPRATAFARRALSALALLVALLFAPVSAGLAQGASADAVVNVYSARHYDSDELLYDRFEALTGITVNVIEGDSDELIARMTSEGANSPADVFITVDAGRLWRAESAGLLQPVASPVLEATIPASLRHPDGLWFGLTQRVRAVVYNRDAVAPDEITTYEDLADPRWRGRLCIRSSSNIYNQSLVASLIASNGAEAAEAWANGIVENMARPPQGGDTDQIRAVAAGLCDIAVVNHYYLARLAASEDADDVAVADAVGFAFPNQDGRGAHVNVSGAAVVASAPHRANAIRFIEYLTSPAAQRVFAAGNNEYPVAPGVEPTPVVQAFGSFSTDAINVSVYGENNPEAVRIMDRAGWR